LESAGFLASLGNDVTVLARSQILRGFDRECVKKIQDFMGRHGVKFITDVSGFKFEKVGDKKKLIWN
jgi:pyruvate/2-oxoglutarate dehydrogenase complex dihydrolipoamide dehydrogenase (E3) component